MLLIIVCFLLFIRDFCKGIKSKSVTSIKIKNISIFIFMPEFKQTTLVYSLICCHLRGGLIAWLTSKCFPLTYAARASHVVEAFHFYTTVFLPHFLSVRYTNLIPSFSLYDYDTAFYVL